MKRSHVEFVAASIGGAFLQLTAALSPVAIASAVLVPRAAFAQEAGPDTVVLKDGGMLRGTLLEILPGDHATLQLANGQSAKIRWDVIDHIIRNGIPLNTSQAAQPVPTTVVQQPAAPVDQGNVWVHVDGDVDVEMQMINNVAPQGRRVTGSWATMCSAPCDQELPLNGSYRLAGSGVRASKSFKLAGKPGDRVFINADPSSKGAFAGGIVLVSVGVPVFVIGCFVELVVGIVNLASHGSADGAIQGSYVDTSGAQVVGLSMMGLGTAGVITGIVLIATNGSTKFDETIAPPETKSDATKKAASLGNDLFKRTPIWKDHEGPTLPPVQSVPLFTGTF